MKEKDNWRNENDHQNSHLKVETNYFFALPNKALSKAYM